MQGFIGDTAYTKRIIWVKTNGVPIDNSLCISPPEEVFGELPVIALVFIRAAARVDGVVKRIRELKIGILG